MSRPASTAPNGVPPHRFDLVVTLVSGLLLVAWDGSGLDLSVVGWFGSSQGFALRDTWWTRDLLHGGGRILAMLLLVATVFDCWRPFLPGPGRRIRLCWLGATLAALLLIPAIKRVSDTSCPWDLAMFGGTAQYVSHWRFGLHDGGSGHCFPSGHAVSAFAYMSLYFLWRDHRPQLARWLLVGVMASGAAFGFGQLVRGAHYPSHTLWSAWLCWALCAAWSRLFNPETVAGRALRRPRIAEDSNPRI